LLALSSFSASICCRPSRICAGALVGRLGETGYKILFALLSVGGFVLLVWGRKGRGFGSIPC
jgi:hypothetical protein